MPRRTAGPFRPPRTKPQHVSEVLRSLVHDPSVHPAIRTTIAAAIAREDGALPMPETPEQTTLP